VSQYPSRPIAPKTGKASRNHTKADDEYLDKIVSFGCCVCRRMGLFSPAEAHHPRTGAGAGMRSKHNDAIPLCPNHHRNGPEALHVMGRKAWERYHGVTELELLAEVRKCLGL